MHQTPPGTDRMTRPAHERLYTMTTPTNKTINTVDPLAAEIKRLREANALMLAQLNSKSNQSLTMKVSAKGAVSVYGLGRFPVTLYTEGKTEGGKGQWQRLAEAMPAILKFIEVNQVQIRKARTLADSAPTAATPAADSGL